MGIGARNKCLCRTYKGYFYVNDIEMVCLKGLFECQWNGWLCVCTWQGNTAHVRRRVARPYELHATQSHPLAVRVPISALLCQLSEEHGDALAAVGVTFGQIDFVAEDHQPLVGLIARLVRQQHQTVRRIYHFAVLSERSGVVEDEKFSGAKMNSVEASNTAVRVMVLPLPGGPHKIKGWWVLRKARTTST